MNLPPSDVDLFYRLRDSLLAFANRELKILPAGTLPDQVRKHPIQEIVKLRNACYEKPALLEQYLAANPDRFPANELAIVASWRHRIIGEFYIIRHLKAYTVFMSLKEPEHLYGVLGLIDPLEVVLGGAPLPLMVEATLLPFRDRIIYEGILNPYRIFFGPGIRRSANATYNRLKEREGIIESLVGPDGQPQIRTSLARKTPAKARQIGGRPWTRSWPRPKRCARPTRSCKAQRLACCARPQAWPRRPFWNRGRRTKPRSA